MRLLMTTDTVGGVWTFTRELAAELLRRGHAVHLVNFGRPPSPDQTGWAQTQAACFGDDFQFTPTDIPLEWMEDNSRAFAEGEPRLRSIAEDFQPDLLLASQFCFGALSGSLPRIVIAHSDVLSWAKSCKPEAATPSPWLNRYTSLVQSGLLQADTVVAPTRWMAQALAQNFFLPQAGTVIPNGCSLLARTSSVKQLQAVTAGRLWDEAKGLDLLLENQFAMPVLVAGETESAKEKPVAAPANSLHFLGRLPAEQLQDVFRESAVYLCTSRYEPFGLAPLEAALCGCAVVARDLPSLREVWGEGAVYFRDASELQAQLSRLAQGPDLLAEAQNRAASQAALYTVARMADGYLSVAETVLEKHRTMAHVA